MRIDRTRTPAAKDPAVAALEKRDQHAFTVIFYIDADRAVETFAEHVTAADRVEAWELAVAQAKKNAGSSTGHDLSAQEWENATEIATFAGHLTEA